MMLGMATPTPFTGPLADHHPHDAAQRIEQAMRRIAAE